jgi:hypothetical protein
LAQIFSPSADTWLRTLLAGAVAILAGATFVVGGYARSTYQNQVGWVQDQPVPFSHRHHAGELGIDCRYCHSGVETGAVAGLPPTHTCMTCHSQLWTGAAALAPVRRSYATGTPIRWQRVAQLPDYVYFDHHVHVRSGVACVACHGRIDQMPLTWRAEPFTMRFCLQCHRSEDHRLRPPAMVTRMDWSRFGSEQLEAYSLDAAAHRGIDRKRLVNCETCHR